MVAKKKVAKPKPKKGNGKVRIVIKVPEDHAKILNLAAQVRDKPLEKWEHPGPGRVVEDLIADQIDNLKAQVKKALAGVI